MNRTRPGTADARLQTRAFACAGELASTVAGLEYSRAGGERARTFFEEGLTLARELDDLPVMAHCLNGLAGLANTWEGRPGHQTARHLHEQALAIYRRLGDRPGIALVLGQLAFMAYHGGDEERARGLAEEGLKIARELGDPWRQQLSVGILGMVAHRQGDLSLARKHHEERLLLLEELGLQYLLPQVLAHLGQIAFDQGDDTSARAFYERAVEVGRQADRFRFDLGFGLCGQGDVARRRGAYAEARTFHEECWPIFHQLGYLLGAVHSLNALGEASRRAGDRRAARAFLRESLTILREWPDEHKTIECLEELAELLAVEGRGEQAARLLAAAERLREDTLSDPRPTPGHPRYPRVPPEALAGRLKARFPAAWAEGRQMGRAEAIHDALRQASPA